jgi:predicted nucleic acid-binding Zn finger protein
MQQLTIEHKNKTTDQKVVEKAKKDRRPGKGRTMALSRRIYRLQNTDIFYVESETRDDQYYFVKFKPDVLESWCSCKDNSTRGVKCKHLWGIEFALKWGTIKDIDEIPNIADQSTSNNIAGTNPVELVTKRTKSYLEDDYNF